MIDQGEYPADLFLNLFWQNEQVGIILAKGTDPHHSVQRAGKFMAVNLAVFRNADRQLPVGMQAVFINQHMPRAIHRLKCELVLIDICEVHFIFVMIIMSGLLPQPVVHHQRCTDFTVLPFPLNPRENSSNAVRTIIPFGR